MVMVLLPPAALESKIAWRREPAPLSLPLVTSKLAAHAVQGAARACAEERRGERAAQRRARKERAPERPSRGRVEMDSLTPPSRVARGPGLPALQAHNSPIRHRDDPAGLFTLTPAAFFRPHRAGGTTRGQSAREPPPPIARALCLSCRSGNDRFDCVALRVSRVQRNAPPRCKLCDVRAVRCGRGTVRTACATVPVLQRITTQSRSGDCVNLSALLRCARDTRSPRVTHRAGAGAGALQPTAGCGGRRSARAKTHRQRS